MKTHFCRCSKFSIAVFAILCIFTGITNAFSSPNRPLMRFPDIHENMIVFTYGEDIWTVPVQGGVASRLTIHDGVESAPKFSPDGKLIAFTGEYDGNSDIFVMNIYGGEITRVTFHPGSDQVVGWHPLKNKIIFRSTRNSFNGFTRLFLISPDGSGLEELIMTEAAQGSFSPDGKKIAFNKVSTENATWKRYRGGLAQEVYLYDFETNQERNLTNFPGTDRLPMWIGNKIYFSSDRNRLLNLYEFDLPTNQIKQLTFHQDYDVRRPSDGGNLIVYEVGGTLWTLDVTTGVNKAVAVEIKTDAPDLRPYLKDVSDLITDFDCSPSGARALVVARGEIFSVPKEDGPTQNLTKNCGSRDKDASWSPDGKTIAYISDKTGEYELYIMDASGKKEAIALTQHKDGYRHTLRWSPDSKKIAFADQTLRCYYVDVATRKVVEIDHAEYEDTDVSLDLKPINDYAWSPDSRFITYSKMNSDLVYQVFIYSVETAQKYCVSNGIFSDFGPVFSRNGKHLFFISNRRFDPTFCDFEWEMVYKKAAAICCLTLQKDGAPLLPFKNNVEEIKTEEKSDAKDEKAKNDKKDKKESADADKAPNIVIDFDGLGGRIEMLPLPRGNYRNLAVTDDDLFYLNKAEGDFNRFEFRAVGSKNLYAFSFKDRKERLVIEGIDGYKIAAQGKHLVYKKENKVGIIETSEKESSGKDLNLADLKMWLNPIAEWTQIFNEAWRMERDFYYEPAMHGIDWLAMKEKYGKLLESACCREDVRYIIGELIGELNTSHTYVFGGDRQRQAERVNIGMLGADWQVDPVAKRYQFKKIYRVPDWTDDVIPPLALPGLNVKEGDYLLQVNGIEVTSDRNIYSYFQNLANKQVTLLINTRPALTGAREITVKPSSNEFTLRYLDWVEHNRLVAEKESNGQIGYIHLPDTYTGSAAEFPKYFYSQTRKKGLIIDGRFNGGGLDPDIFLQRLAKRPLAFWTRRYSAHQTTPAVATQAHMVCLTNRQAGSGGDMLPMEFQMRKMGPIIGTRTWGGLVGVSMFLQLIDGGGLSAPDYRIYDPAGKWIVENTGVQPDIEVELNSLEMQRGYDAQLMKGIEFLMQKIKDDPRPWPKHEAFPVDR